MYDHAAYQARYRAGHRVEAAAYRAAHREDKQAYDRDYSAPVWEAFRGAGAKVAETATIRPAAGTDASVRNDPLRPEGVFSRVADVYQMSQLYQCRISLTELAYLRLPLV